jgi:hypothetical protein
MLINETEFTAMASDIIEYTIPLVKEYTWSLLNRSAVKVSDVWVDLSNPETDKFLNVPSDEDVMFAPEIFPEIKPVAVKSLTVAKTDDDIFAPETLPEIKPVAVKSLTVAKTDDDIFVPETFPESNPVTDTFLNVAKVFTFMSSTVNNDLKSTVF